jgi:hypothetical protein
MHAIIERVAAALWAHDQQKLGRAQSEWPEAHPSAKEFYRSAALVALAAIEAARTEPA